jgi:hypothetical protein
MQPRHRVAENGGVPRFEAVACEDHDGVASEQTIRRSLKQIPQADADARAAAPRVLKRWKPYARARRRA